MGRGLHKLSEATVRSDKLTQGRHSDGGGLYLTVTPAGTKSWVFMWTREGRRREMGLGPYPTMGLAKARKSAASCREAVAHGRDPIAERDRASEPTFGECADLLIESMEGSWRNKVHRDQWRMTLRVYAEPIREKRVSLIDTDDILKVLSPIWTSKAETASRFRGRLERVLDFAKARGWRTGENPALWRGHLKNVLPTRQKLQRGHHAAMPYPELPAFMERVRAAEAMAARCIEFVILTAARTSEAREATWFEVDLEKALWTVPARRMKAGKEHRVPLAPRAVELLRQLQETRQGDLIFPGQRAGRPLSIMAMHMLLRRLKVDVTVHGFRSSFRDWCGEETSYPREIAEQALAHVVGDATERAYRRGDAVERRRALMIDWANYLGSKE